MLGGSSAFLSTALPSAVRFIVLLRNDVCNGPIGLPPKMEPLMAFQYTDEHGEVCPANWKPGAKTMIDEPEKSQAYFSTLS